ncbi:MAG: serine hydrolase [Bacillota bacterium]
MNIGGKDKSLASKLQEFLVEQKGEKGAAISAAIVKDGQLIAACTAGKRGTDGTPADIGDLYNLGSIAKIYCATAIMKLVEMGNIDLRRYISKAWDGLLFCRRCL